jgi:ribonuclease VapC
MIIDSSALVAILQAESESKALVRAILKDNNRFMSSGNVLETGMLIHARYGDDGTRDLDLLISKLGIDITKFTQQQASIARKAFADYGKGRHPAGLNFGDCIAYATAKDTGENLLFKGKDFLQTDILAVSY